LSCKPVLIADTAEQISEAQIRLARVGIEKLCGYLQGGVAAWQKDGLPMAQFPEISVQSMRERRRDLRLIDVRREGEWKAGHIDGAEWFPLDNLNKTLPSAERDTPIAVHCKSGYRSAIACSLLQRAGFTNVSNVLGGFDAWQAASLPFLTEETVKA